jgi:flagellar basal-body rod modification protein FlgD
VTSIDVIQDASAPSGRYSGLTAAQLATGQDFFRLLSAQLQSQDPLEPLQETEFLGQLAQYSQLQQSLETNERLHALTALQESLAALNQMTQSAALIDKTVDNTHPAAGEPRSGVVQAVRVEDGLLVLDVDGTSVPLPNVTAIRTQE